MTWEFLKVRNRRSVIAAAGAVTAATAATAAVLAANAGSAGAADVPVLTTVPYTAAAGSDGALTRPDGVAAAGGTVYVSNAGDSVVAALSGGSTAIIAGSLENFGEHGDGGQATAATLYHPGGTAVDGKGDAFIADAGDNVVREITASGVIKRIAGTGSARGPLSSRRAASASLDYPEGVAVDASGDVFIADTFNNRVVEVTPAARCGRWPGRARPATAATGTRPSTRR